MVLGGGSPLLRRRRTRKDDDSTVYLVLCSCNCCSFVLRKPTSPDCPCLCGARLHRAVRIIATGPQPHPCGPAPSLGRASNYRGGRLIVDRGRRRKLGSRYLPEPT